MISQGSLIFPIIGLLTGGKLEAGQKKISI